METFGIVLIVGLAALPYVAVIFKTVKFFNALSKIKW